ncbi:MAG TPA: hypothetical protein VF323_01870 [Candidatus Limnocylindrales bacterium]
MIPGVLLISGLAALGGAVLVLRSFGPGYRIGRLLATTPPVSVADAASLARAGAPDYVRIDGRIDADDEFEDEHHRPLVFRRKRLEVRRGGTWETIDDAREAVRFEIRDGLEAVAIDADALGPGLVVIPREAVGTAADAPDRVPTGLPSDTPMRLRIEQVSSVEHATVLGVPEVGPDGTIRITAGHGRPLILTTLEPPEAMRLLAGGRRARPAVAGALLAGGCALLAVGSGWALVGGLH